MKPTVTISIEEFDRLRNQDERVKKNKFASINIFKYNYKDNDSYQVRVFFDNKDMEVPKELREELEKIKKETEKRIEFMRDFYKDQNINTLKRLGKMKLLEFLKWKKTFLKGIKKV